MRILFATMEIDPFLKLSAAADFLRSLPQGLQELGHEIRILMPKFGVINERRNRLHEVVRLSGINIRVGDDEKPLTIKVATIPNARIQVYFLDNDDYFQRRAVLSDPKSNTFFQDNDERAIFFCKGVIETVKKLGWGPDIIHCHGWMTSLIPLYLKTHYKDDPIFANSKIVYTLYNDQSLNQPLPEDFTQKAKLEGISEEALNKFAGETYIGMTKGGIEMADAATKGYEELPGELEQAISAKAPDLSKQLNGNGETQEYVEYYNELYQHIAS
jgi:starch synthase